MDEDDDTTPAALSPRASAATAAADATNTTQSDESSGVLVVCWKVRVRAESADFSTLAACTPPDPFFHSAFGRQRSIS